MIENTYIKRADHVLMLICLKKDNELLKQFEKSRNPIEITKAFWNTNKEWNFKKTISEFSNVFPKYKDAILLLEDFWVDRDVLSHCQVNPNGTFFCVLHDGSRKNKSKNQIIKRRIGRELYQNEALQVEFLPRDYDERLNEFNRFDQIYFPNICTEMGIRYEALRWPRDEKK